MTGLPTSGTLNVRLWSWMSGGWQYTDYTYTMNAAVKAVMSSPTPGSTLTSSSATFSWTTGSGVTSYWLHVGKYRSGFPPYNIFNNGGTQILAHSDGACRPPGTLNVRLWSWMRWRLAVHRLTPTP